MNCQSRASEMLSDIHTSEPSRCRPRTSVCTVGSSPFTSLSTGPAARRGRPGSRASWRSRREQLGGAAAQHLAERLVGLDEACPRCVTSAMPMAAWVKALWKRLSLSFSSSTWRSSDSLRWK